MSKTRTSLIAASAAFAVVLGLLGCAEDVTAVRGTERTFSLYGALSPQLDSQWVLVFPVEGRLVPVPATPLDARFTSTDVQTGAVHVWRDSLVRQAPGDYAHVFWAPFAADYGRTYRLAVERPDGAAAHVEVEVPDSVQIVVQPPEVTPVSVVSPVLVAGEPPRLLHVTVRYVVDYQPVQASPRFEEAVTLSYEGRGRRTADGWLLPLDLGADFVAVRDTLTLRHLRPLDQSYGLVLHHVTLRLMVANEAWNPPEGGFSPEVLVQPGTLSNVTNGYGFVGAGFWMEERWRPPAHALTGAGFRVGGRKN